jgi:MPBQ/MSBQ methyltransferase
VQGTGQLEGVAIEDWTPQTLPTWRHSNWVGVWDPWPVILKLNPVIWYKVRSQATALPCHQALRCPAIKPCSALGPPPH